MEILTIFRKNRLLNVILLWTNAQGELIIARSKNFQMNISFEKLDHNDIRYLFPNKLQNLNGLEVNGVMMNQYPRLWIQNGRLVGRDIRFLNIFLQQHNCSLHVITRTNKFITENMTMMYEILLNADLILNTGLTIYLEPERFRQVFTHELKSFCICIPRSPRIPFYYYLVAPFDSVVWALVSLALIFASILWHIIKIKRFSQSQHSSGYFLFGVYSLFVGQSLNMIKLCLLQTCILQLFVFLTFIMGNCYQSLIISLMSDTRDAKRINTLSDLKNSELFVLASPLYYDFIFENDLDREWQKKLIKQVELSNNLIEYYNQNFALIVSCDVAELLLFAYASATENSKFYYMLAERTQTLNNFYLTAKDNLFADSLELFANKVFESGIRQYWRTIQRVKDERDYADLNYLLDEEFLLKIDDMVYIFYLLGLGLAISFIVFIYEVCQPNIKFAHRKRFKMRSKFFNKFRRTLRRSEK